jgi:methyl-accepting chemotaxis protein
MVALNDINNLVAERGGRVAARVDSFFYSLEEGPKIVAAIVADSLPQTDDEFFALLENSIASAPNALGASVAFAKGKYSPDKELYAPSVSKEGGRAFIDPERGSYDYLSDASQGRWFREALQAQKPIWTEPSLGGGAGATGTLSYGVPFQLRGEWAGVATVDASLAALADVARDAEAPPRPDAPSAYFFIVSREGQVISHPRELMVANGENLFEANINSPKLSEEDKALWRKVSASAGQNGDFYARLKNVWDDDGVSYKLIHFAPLNATGWLLGSCYDEKEAFAPMRRLVRNAVIFHAACLALLVVAVYFSVTGLVRRLEGMAQGLSQKFKKFRATSAIITECNQDMFLSANDQSSQFDELDANLLELSKSSEENRKQAQGGANLSRETTSLIEAGSSSVTDMAKAMVAIRDSSESIEEILKNIENISFQTNLLALNASVEAARAGEAGSGFAIVAEEVRNLAQRSAESVHNTTAFIGANHAQVANGDKISQKLSQSFQKISLSAGETIEALEAIMGAVMSDGEKIANLNVVIGNLRDISNETMENAQKAMSAVVELVSESESLSEVIASVESQFSRGKPSPRDSQEEEG